MSVHTPHTHETSSIAPSEVTLANTVVELEDGPAGVVARVDHVDGRTDYAGPLDEPTIAALWEVGR